MSIAQDNDDISKLCGVVTVFQCSKGGGGGVKTGWPSRPQNVNGGWEYDGAFAQLPSMALFTSHGNLISKGAVFTAKL
jgi:hypothetical protein